MKRPVKHGEEVSARELIAQALFMNQRPFQHWGTVRDAMRNVWLHKADLVLKATGLENAKLVKGELPLVMLDKED